MTASRRALALLAVAFCCAAPGVARANPPTLFALTATPGDGPGAITGDDQGFSVESADFAHGFITDARLGNWLKTLGPQGVLRLGGYSMDLVWPAFGDWADQPAPAWAIGGTVEQSDFDALKALLDDTGWKTTLGAPLASVLAGQVTLDQAVAEAVAAHATLGDDLLYVEVGNEYDHVTTLTAAQYYDTMKRYQAAIAAAGVPVKMAGPSANTSGQNARLDEFVTAALADGSAQSVIGDLTSHWYPGSHCGTNTTSIAALMSPQTHTTTAAKLQGIMAIAARLPAAIPASINESNSASCSGQAGVSDSYATALWSLDYLMQTAQSGIRGLSFHTSTAALCGDLKPRDSDLYPISYRFYAAFCAPDQAALDGNRLDAAPLYYGIWAFRQVPPGPFLDLDLPDSALAQLRAYAVAGTNGTTTVVLINVQDPAAPASTQDVVALRLPAPYRRASAVVLQGTAPEGLASTDRGAVRLGGRAMTATGTPDGAPIATPVAVAGNRSLVTVRPGTAKIVTFSR